MANILLAPTYKLQDRVAILGRVLDALLADEFCRYTFRGDFKVAPEEIANWDARETIVRLKRSFPAEQVRQADNPPPSEVESPNANSVDQPTQA